MPGYFVSADVRRLPSGTDCLFEAAKATSAQQHIEVRRGALMQSAKQRQLASVFSRQQLLAYDKRPSAGSLMMI